MRPRSVTLDHEPAIPDVIPQENGDGESKVDILTGWFNGEGGPPCRLTLAVWPRSLTKVAHLIRPHIVVDSQIPMTEDGVFARCFALAPDKMMAREIVQILSNIMLMDIPRQNAEATAIWLNS